MWGDQGVGREREIWVTQAVPGVELGLKQLPKPDRRLFLVFFGLFCGGEGTRAPHNSIGPEYI